MDDTSHVLHLEKKKRKKIRENLMTLRGMLCWGKWCKNRAASHRNVRSKDGKNEMWPMTLRLCFQFYSVIFSFYKKTQITACMCAMKALWLSNKLHAVSGIIMKYCRCTPCLTCTAEHLRLASVNNALLFVCSLTWFIIQTTYAGWKPSCSSYGEMGTVIKAAAIRCYRHLLAPLKALCQICLVFC